MKSEDSQTSLTKNEVTGVPNSKQALEQYIRQHKLNKDFLDQVAESTLDNILEGTFVTPKH